MTLEKIRELMVERYKSPVPGFGLDEAIVACAREVGINAIYIMLAINEWIYISPEIIIRMARLLSVSPPALETLCYPDGRAQLSFKKNEEA